MELETMEGRTTTTSMEGGGVERRTTPLEMHEMDRTRTSFPWISWSAIFAGLVAGLGTYILLALLGLAGGLTAINPQSTEPVGKVPMITGIWTAISLILSAFVGGYVASRMSGFTRMADGILHGLVAWGASTLVFAFLITSSIGAVLGGAFSFLGQTAKTVVTSTATTAGGAMGGGTSKGQLETMLKGGTGGGKITAASMTDLENRLAAGDRNGAIDVMVNEMGFTRDRAEKSVDPAMTLFGSTRALPERTREAATTAVSGLSKITWGVFIGVLLSMGLSVAGGFVGSKAALKRRQPLSSAMAH